MGDLQMHKDALEKHKEEVAKHVGSLHDLAYKSAVDHTGELAGLKADVSVLRHDTSNGLHDLHQRYDALHGGLHDRVSKVESYTNNALLQQVAQQAALEQCVSTAEGNHAHLDDA
eukprot:20902-Eustigmatos_ZCMA.PRE.1